jgi:hypothetical protein
MSTGMSRYSKTRSNSAEELLRSTPTLSSDWIGQKMRVCSVVNATTVPIETAPPSRPANRYTSAGITAKEVWTVAIIQRPAMRERTSRSASRSDSRSKPSASAALRPIDLPSSTPDTLSDSCTSDEMSAITPWRSVVIFLRWLPTRRATPTNTGVSASEKTASRQSSRIIATIVAATVVTLETIEVAVLVTTVCTPPMSLAMRDWISPVRVRVKNASERRWRWR